MKEVKIYGALVCMEEMRNTQTVTMKPEGRGRVIYVNVDGWIILK
jgi:hypothetical protein